MWSIQQDAIFEFVVNAEGHLIVRARAGCGKTTTIVEAVKRYLTAHPHKMVIVCAFNKRIADELTARFAGYTNVEVKTLHALGFAALKRAWERVRVNDPKKDHVSRKDDLANAVCSSKVPDAVKRLVAKLHTLGRETHPHATQGEQLLDLATEFDCVPDEQWVAAGYTVEWVCDRAVAAMERAANFKPTLTGIDFADMIFLPIRNGWLFPLADLVVVDEAQDMTVAQLEIARGISRGRLVVVGDDRQAIYSFRGADSESLDRLKRELQASELGLTTTYRCGHAIVAEAAVMVPDFVAGTANHAGLVVDLAMDRLGDTVALGDFVLSRTNAPLVAVAMRLLREGKRTRIAGRDIGAGLKTLVGKLVRNASGVPDLLERIEIWQERECIRATRQARNPEQAERKVEEVLDRAEMIRNLAEEAKNVRQVEQRIEALFTDDGLGQAGVITCSSVHRAKGLEAERVFVLADTLREDTPEEINIKYVAVTRAKRELVYVTATLDATDPHFVAQAVAHA